MNPALTISLSYAAFAALWILMSDKVLAWLFTDPAAIVLASTLKGWLFVAVTASLLYALMRRHGMAGPALPAGTARLPRRPLIVLSLVIVTLTASIAYHAVTRQHDEELLHLRTIAALKSQQLADWLRERRGDAEFVRSSAFFAERYRHWLEDGNTASGQQLHSRLELFRRSQAYDSVLLLDADGQVRWHSVGRPGATTPALLQAAGQAAADGRIRLAAPAADGHGNVYLDLVVPLPTISSAPPLIVLRSNLAGWLFPMLSTWPTPSATAESLLFRRDGEEIVFFNKLRHRPESGGQPRFPVTGKLLAARALRGEVAAGEAVSSTDYRGVPVLGVAQAIPETDWYMVTKIDQAELYQRAIGEAVWIALSGLFALFAVGIGLLVLRQRQQLQLAEDMRRSQEDRLRALNLLGAIADASEDAIFAKDLAGRYLLFNRAAERWTGQPASAVIGHDDRQLFPPAQAAEVMANDRQVMEQQRQVTFQEDLPTGIGERVFLTIKGPLRDAGEQIIGLFGISRDITERHQAANALLASESRFRALVEQSVAGIYIIQDGQLRYVNPGFARIFGYPAPEALDGVPIADLVSPEDRRQVADNIHQRLTGTVDEAPYTITGRRRDGSPVALEILGRRFDYEGRPAIIGLLFDITARQAAEAALRQSEQRFQDVVAASADWIWEVDTAWRYTYMSASVEKLRGFTPAEMLGKTPFDFMPPEEARRIRELLDYSFARQLPIRNLENVSIAKDGSLAHTLTSATPIIDAEGAVRGYRGLDHDVTDKKFTELFLRQQAEGLGQRNAELERFNRAMVGREIDMIELKKTINELSRQLGRETPHRLTFLDSPAPPPAAGKS